MPDPRIDHILLAASTTERDVESFIAFVSNEARRHTATPYGVVVPPIFARQAVDALRGKDIRVASVAGYPLGFAKPTIKAIEATNLAKDGVDAVELTPLLANLLADDLEPLRAELLEVVRGVRAARPTATVHVRIDIDSIPPSQIRQIALHDAVVRGACDGIVFESASPHRVAESFAGWPMPSPLERKFVPTERAALGVRVSPIDAIGVLPFGEQLHP